MFTVVIKAESDVTDMDWLKRRIEAMYFEVVLVDRQLIVTGRLHQQAHHYFMLCDMLHRNMPLLVSYKVDDETAAKQRAIEDGVKSSHSISCSLAERNIREQDPT